MRSNVAETVVSVPLYETGPTRLVPLNPARTIPAVSTCAGDGVNLVMSLHKEHGIWLTHKNAQATTDDRRTPSRTHERHTCFTQR